MKCGSIHFDTCDGDVEPDFLFCPRCGRATSRIKIGSDTPTLLFERKEISAALAFQVRGFAPAGFDARFIPTDPLRIQAGGEAKSRVALRFPAPNGGTPVAGDPVPARTVGLPLKWESDGYPPVERPLQIPLFFSSFDGPPLDGFELGWENRRRNWDALYLQVQSSAPGKLEIDTAVLVFGDNRPVRQLRLRNVGGEPLMLRPPVFPAGFEIEAAPGTTWTLAPGTAGTWSIRALGPAPEGESTVELKNQAGEALGSILLIVGSEAATVTRTRYVIGVDFGTSGTSVWKRDGRDDRAKAEPLPDPHAVLGRDDPRRFPSVIYIPFANGHETGFYIGYEALQKQDQDGGRGLLVRELKSLLRTDEEPFTERFGSNYRVDTLLRRYMQKLRESVVNPNLENGGEGISVAWNFSIPVLDSHRGRSGTLFNKQKGRLEQALRAARWVGVTDSLEFFTEPFCAAVYLLLEHGDYRFPRFQTPEDGDWACIFDSGGGTTDVVLGRLWMDGADLRFEEVATLGGYLDSASGEVATFGGEALKRTTAIYLSIWKNDKGQAYDYLRSELAQIFRDNSSQGRPNAGKEEEVYANMMRVALQAPHREEILDSPEIQDPKVGKNIINCWTRFPRIWEKTESYKRQLAGLGSPAARAQIRLPAQAAGGSETVLSIPRSEFDSVVVNRRLEAIGAEMRARIFQTEAKVGDEELPSPVNVRWVFGVGGNCRVRRIHDYLQEFFPGGVQELTRTNPDNTVDESDRMLAVAGGAVWANKARRDNALPYDLRVEDERGDPIFIAPAHVAASSVAPTERIYELGADKMVKFRVLVKGKLPVGAESLSFDGVAGQFSVRNHASTEPSNEGGGRRAIAVRAQLTGKKLQISSDASGQSEVIFTYSY